MKRAFIGLILKVSGNVNADMGVGTRIPLKKIYTWNQEVKAFVSARCIRRCIRERLYEKGEKIDGLMLIGKRERQLGDIGDPIEYIDDDLFGFMVPEAIPRKRYSPIKISHLISLTHTEIKPEFAARFPREFIPDAPKEYPVPFEIEVAEWLGRLDVIVSDRIGVFEEDELKDEQKNKLNKIGNKYFIDNNTRRERLKKFLEILLWEGWQFPRAAQSPSVPEFYHSIIALTESFVPIFGCINVEKEGKLPKEVIEKITGLYGKLIDKMFVLDYKGGEYIKFEKTGEETLQEEDKQVLNADNITKIIEEICEYVVFSQK